MAHKRLRERDERCVGGVVSRSCGRRWGRGAPAAALEHLEQAVAAAMERLRGQAADLLEPVAVARRPSGELHQSLVRKHEARRPVHRAGHVLAPLDQLPRHRAPAVAQAPEAGQALVDGGGAALVAHFLERPALLARPVEAFALDESALELAAERQQQAGVVARVSELLGREGAPIPARETLAALEPHL